MGNPVEDYLNRNNNGGEVKVTPTGGAEQENESSVVGGGFDPTRYVPGVAGDLLTGLLFAYETALQAGQGAVGIVDDIVQGFETGEYVSGIPQSLAGQNILLQVAKAKAENKRDTYENYVVDMVKKGASEKLIKEQDPTNTVKMEKLTDWFEKTLPAPAVDSETGEVLDYISLYGRGEIIKGTDALIGDIAGSFPSLLISRVPVVGPAILGASTYMGEFESELIKRAKDPNFNLEEDRDNLVQNALITGAADFVWETVGGSMLNKIPGMKLGKEKVVDIIKESPKQLLKKAGLGFLSEFTTEGATGVTTELADVLSFGDDVKPIKDYFRTFFKDGFIGGFLGASSSGASGLSAQNKEVIHEYVSPQTYKQDQFKLSTEILTLEQDKQKAKGKDVEYFETKIQELRDKKKANKENLNNFFNSLTKEQKVEYASNIDKQNDAIDIIGNKDYSKEAQEIANKDLAKYTEANNKFFKDTEVNYIADFENYAKRTISNAAKLRKARGVFGFDNKNLNLVELNTAEEIKEVNDRLPGFNEADGLFLGEDASGKPTMYINKKVAAETGATNVLGHEYLHAITSMAFKESGIGNENLGKAAKAFTEYLKSTGNSQVVEDIEERLAENYGGLDADGNIIRDENGLVKTSKKEQQEEYFNLFSDLISKEKIKNVEEKSGGIKNAFRQLFVGLGFSKVDFQDGQEVFDYLVDYNANMERAGILGKFVSKRIAKTKMKGLEATAAEKAAMDLIKKESKSGYNKTDRDNRLDAIGEKSTKAEWDAGGSDQAISDMYMSGDLEAIVRNNLSSDLKSLPNYSEEDFISETISELMPHIRRFNIDMKETKSGFGLSGWIRGQISNKIGNVLKNKKATTETFTVDTTDEKVKETIESNDDLQNLQEEDLSIVAQTKKKAKAERREEKGMEEDVEYSTFRRALKVKGKQGLSDNIVDNVKQAVVKTMATERTTPDSDKFIANIKKSFLTELKKPIQDMMGKKEDFTNFLKTNREAIIAALPTSTLVQMERNVDPADRVFTVEVKRNLNPTETDDAIANNLLPKDTNRNSGPTLYNKRMPSEGEFLRYFSPPLYVPSKKDPNKSVRSGLKGTRKDTLAEQMGIELAFDATMEVVQSPDVAERRSLVTNTDFIDSGIEELARSIGRGVDVKFSKSKFKITRDGLVATGLGIQDGIIFDPETKTYKLAPEVIDYMRKNTPKPRKNKTKPKTYYPSSEVLGYFKDFYNDLPTSAQLDLSLQGEAIGTEMGRLSKLISGTTEGHLFEAVIARYGYDTLKSVQPGITIISKKQAAKKLGTTSSKLPDIVLWDGKNKWESADSLFTVEAKFDNSRAGGVTITDYKFKDFTPNNTKVLNKYDSLDETGEVINETWKQDMLKQFSEPLAIFVKEAEALGTKIVDSKTKVPIGVHNALRKKGNSFLSKVRAIGKVEADQIVNYYNNGKFKPVKSDVIAHTSKGAFTLGVDPHGLYANGILPKLAGDYQVTMRLKTNVSKDKTFVTYTPILEIEFRSSDIKGEYADGRKVDASDLKLQNKKDFETILKNVKGFKLSKSQSTSKAMELGQLTNKDTEAVGMSTFDFDETLIIDGDNFITATKGDDVVKITSGQWPLVGDAYVDEGYTFDFSDFVNVRGGVDGPLLQKMKNQISKYGVKNVFVLTARPAESATAIQGWLESKGINIPLENITGLGNSSGAAKAQWMLDKFAEGYNDMYFVDDALPNVKAVKNVLDQLDIKSDVQQAKIKFSKTASKKLNDMIERKKGIDSDEIISSAAARRKGENVNKFQIFVPPTAEDFSGLLYYFAGKGKQGDADLAFMKEFLLDPLSRGERDIAIKKQSLIRGYNELKNNNKEAAAKIKEMAADTPYTKGSAVRVYLWNQDKTDIPGLSDKEVQELVDIVKNDPELIAYADALRALVGDSEGKYIVPSNDWVVETIAKDLQDATSRVGRKKFLAEFIENADAFFSKDNLNKMEAAYGKDFRESLEDMLYRIKTGQNRPSGTDASTKKWMNWLNNSVGAIMFFNTKSAVLQLMSTVNYLNWSDNNLLLAGKAFANQKQFWSDFSMLWNSDFLKQRRFGLSTDINEAEIANAAAGAKNKATAVLAYLLKKGFLPTQIADSFAISSGGAAFYRNRVNSYVKQGMDQKAAEEKAMTDFREITEENQQSSRPDRISKQQASPLGRVILAFQNTPMQYARIIKKSVADIVAGRGDLKTHVSKIIFYGGVQSLIFGAMQNALFALAFDDEEDDKNLTKTELEKKQKKRDTQYERTLNTMLDSLLNGSGLTGRVLSTVKNVIFKFLQEKDKGWNSDMGNVAIEAANISPPLGSKLRKMKKAGDVYDWNQKVIDEMDTFDINNPIWEAGANVIESTTNVPAARAIKKLESIREAFNQNNETWQRIAVAMGWSQWDLGIEGKKRQAIQETKEELKQRKKDEKAKSKKPSSKKRTVKKSSPVGKYLNINKPRKNEASKVEGGEYRCTALTQDLRQCKNRTDNSSRKCFLHN
tara:strand:- start:311 stop:7786 length:7476 start_codon:yes stop_codon:yes gene_type:complete